MLCGLGEIPDNLKDKIKVSPTSISTFLETPAHYYARYHLKLKRETESMLQGRRLHMAVLEPNRFINAYMPPLTDEMLKSLEIPIYSTVDDYKRALELLNIKPTGKKAELIQKLKDAGHKFLDYDEACLLVAQGREMLTQTEWDRIAQIKSTLSLHKRLAMLMSQSARTELKAWVYLDDLDVVLRCVVDWFSDSGHVIDVKACPKADRHSFEKKIFYENLYVQGAIIIDVLEELHRNNLGPKPKSYILAAHENSLPYIWQPYVLNGAALDAGQVMYKKAILGILECYQKNEWPAYSDKFEDASLPHWGFDVIQNKEWEKIDV